MIVNNLHFTRIQLVPAETEPVLIVDSDTVPSFAIPLERLQVITRNARQIFKRLRLIQLHQFAARRAFNALIFFREPIVKELFSFRIPKRPDHPYSV